ncbi:hypothetical protein CE91St41_37610 [Oscillospiraceae bacterium]|nr:hypothetical protein CE91St40_37590 [Oscillospiraceae bacterium]BDF76872.1 hypothetical protein CE91St41_37610 [Oscillospiraceae bacterium]
MSCKKLLCVLLTLAMAASLLLAPAAAYADTEGHWAAGAIDRWSGEGVVQGAGDRFRPDAPITRAELAVILDRLMAYRTGGGSYSDVVPGAWYEGSIQKAAAAGVMQGDGAGMRPLDTLTRQEAAVLLGRALGVSENAGAADSYTDAADIAAWARGYVGGMTAAGILRGSGGRANPTAPITRAEVVTILDNALSARYAAAGSYSADAAGDVVISAPGVTLHDMAVRGRLIIAEGVGDGAVTLDSVLVKQAVLVRGGGVHSIIIKGSSSIPAVTVERRDGAVRVSVEGAASVETVYVNDGSDAVKIEGSVSAVSVSGAGARLEVTGDVGEIQVAQGAAGAAVTVAEGARVGVITAAAPQAQVSVAGTVDRVETTSTAAGSAVTTEKTAVVKEVVAGAEGTTVSGAGQVEKVTATGDGVAVTTPGTKVEAAEGAAGVTVGGAEIKGGETAQVKPETPSGGGGGGGSSAPAAVTGLEIRCVNTKADYDALPAYVRTGEGGLAWNGAEAPYLVALFKLNVQPPVQAEILWFNPESGEDESIGSFTLTAESFGQTGAGNRFFTVAFDETDPTVGTFTFRLTAGGEQFTSKFVRDPATLAEARDFWSRGGYMAVLGADDTLSQSFTVPSDKALVIPRGVTLAMAGDAALTVDPHAMVIVDGGTLASAAPVVNHGRVINQSGALDCAITNETVQNGPAAKVWQYAAWTGSAWDMGVLPNVTNATHEDRAQPVLVVGFTAADITQLVKAAESARSAVESDYGHATIEAAASMTLPAGQTLSLGPRIDLTVGPDGNGEPTVLTVAGTLRGNPADPPEDDSEYVTGGFSVQEGCEVVITGEARYTWAWLEAGALTLKGNSVDFNVNLTGETEDLPGGRLTVDGAHAILRGGINLVEGADFAAVRFVNGGVHEGPILMDDNWGEPVGQNGELFLTSLDDVVAFWKEHPDKDARLGVDVELSGDFTIPAGRVLVLERPGDLIVPEGKTLTISGALVNNSGVTNRGTIKVMQGGELLNHDSVWNYGEITGRVSMVRENEDIWPEFYQYAALEDDGTENWGWKLNPLPDIKMGEENGSVIAAVRVDWGDPEGIYALRSTAFLKEVFKDDSRGVYTNANVEVRGTEEQPVKMTISEGKKLELPGYMTLAIINSYTTLDVQGTITGADGEDTGAVELIFGAQMTQGSRDRITARFYSDD